VLIPIALALAGFFGVVFLAFIIGVRPARITVAPRPSKREAVAPRSHYASPLPPKGRPEMSNMRRLLDFGGRRRDPDREQVATASPSNTRTSTTRNDLATESLPTLERSLALDQLINPTPDSSANKGEATAETERSEPGEIPLSEEGYAEVGERVGAVLTSAHEAARQIQETARHEAERIRTEADRYGKETREAADRYGAETRRKLDEEALERRAAVEEQARGIRQAAEEKAKSVLRDADDRQRALIQEAGRSEARLQQLLGVFRGMTTQLEELVRSKPEGEPAETSAAATSERRLEDALKPERTPSERV
jgi:hypothetical protein